MGCLWTINRPRFLARDYATPGSAAKSDTDTNSYAGVAKGGWKAYVTKNLPREAMDPQ